MTPRRSVTSLALLTLVVSVTACAASPVDDVDESSGAASNAGETYVNAAAGESFGDLPVVVASVDEATVRWISAETAADGAPVGDTLVRRRDLYRRVQVAVNEGKLRPAFVHYGIHFSASDEAKGVTSAFARAVHDSPVPVVLERDADAPEDKGLYKTFTCPMPRNLVVVDTGAFACKDRECRYIGLETASSAWPCMAPSNPTGLRAAARLAVSSGSLSQREAMSDAKDRMPPSSSTRIDTSVSPGEVLSLKDLLTGAVRPRAVEGAVLVIAPAAEVKLQAGQKARVTLDVLKGQIARWAIRVGLTPKG